MCELLIRCVDKVNDEDPLKDAICLKAGDVVSAVPDGWSWGLQELASPDHVIVAVPDMTLIEAEGLLVSLIDATRSDVFFSTEPAVGRARAIGLEVSALALPDRPVVPPLLFDLRDATQILDAAAYYAKVDAGEIQPPAALSTVSALDDIAARDALLVPRAMVPDRPVDDDIVAARDLMDAAAETLRVDAREAWRATIEAHDLLPIITASTIRAAKVLRTVTPLAEMLAPPSDVTMIAPSGDR